MGQQTENASIDRLAVVVGEWGMAAEFKDLPPADIGARVVVEWMPGRRFLIQRWEVPVPEAPARIARVYKLGLTEQSWKFWRDTPDFPPLEFAQGYTGTFGHDRRVITGSSERCHDGATWEHDFDLTYRRSRDDD